MSQTLYRKYRPQNFHEIIGQEIIKKILQNEIAKDRAAHAYLFSGPRGVGKTSTARIFAKAINCLNRKTGESEPCNACEVCADITAGKCFDVVEIDAASHTGVENVRDNIIEGIRFTPSRAQYKIFIIDEVHMLSKGAFNALLKTLEEPPAHAILILATTETHKVPETIISRCQHFEFHKLSSDTLLLRLEGLAKDEGMQVAREVLRSVARNSGGSVRDAESLLGQLISIAGDDGAITTSEAELFIPQRGDALVLRVYELLAAHDATALLQCINTLADQGIDVEKFYDACISGGRDIMLSSAGMRNGVESEENTRIKKIIDALGVPALAAFVGDLIQKKSLIRFSPLPEIPLELAILNACPMDQGGREKKNEEDNISAKEFQVNDATMESPTTADSPSAKNSQHIAREELQNNSEPPQVITIENIQNRWKEFLSRVADESQSLPLLLSVSQPERMTGNILHISVGYKFHKARLEDAKTAALLQRILKEFFGLPLRLTVMVHDERKNEEGAEGFRVVTPVIADAPSSLLQNILHEFGGQVVE